MRAEHRSLHSGESDLLRSAAGFIYVDDLAHPDPGSEDGHHLVNVLRLRPGELVIAADGNGAYVPCEIAAIEQPARGRGRAAATGQPLLVSIGEIVRTDPPVDPLAVAFAMPKGERADWTVQKLTELGIDLIVPLMSERSVVRLDQIDAEKRGARFRRIAVEAGAQSRRVHLPSIPDPLTFAEFVAGIAPSLDVLAMAEPAGAPLGKDTRSILVGPEGGWSPVELQAVPTRVGMGDTILRAETAAIVAGTLLAERRWERQR